MLSVKHVVAQSRAKRNFLQAARPTRAHITQQRRTLSRESV